MQEELLKLIGFEKPEDSEEEITIDQVREHINGHFVPVSDIPNRQDILEPLMNKAVGQRLGSLQTSLIKSAKEAGLDLKHNDFEGKKLEEIVPDVFGRFKEKLSTVKKPDGKLQEELERYKSELGTYKSTIDELEQQKESIANEYKQKEQGWIVNHAKNQAWGSLKLSPEVDEYKELGFRTKFDSKYDLRSDDTGNVFPVYKDGEKKGSRVQNPAKLSEHLGLQELIQHEAQNAGLLAKANEGKSGGGGQGESGKRTTTPETPNGKVKLNPRFAGQGA
ncbi:MAG: hypothetical protein LC664_12905 [Flavobacteriales bacterium]|nr:hypothetical protein [Flavobacteriales bacterium]